jgi:hypothetical protein
VSVLVATMQLPSGQLDGSFRLAAAGYCDVVTVRIRDTEAAAERAIRRLPGLKGGSGHEVLIGGWQGGAYASSLGKQARWASQGFLPLNAVRMAESATHQC